jgi:predicted nucleic acid-binding protein
MKARVFIETTIPSYLAARPSRNLIVAAHQQTTRGWWEYRRTDFDLFVSELVLAEASAGDPDLARKRTEYLLGIEVLPIGDEIMELGEALMAKGVMPRKASADAVHVASATVYGCDYLLTWNCSHIANAEIRRAARYLVSGFGYDLPVICTPEELMGQSYDDNSLEG